VKNELRSYDELGANWILAKNGIQLDEKQNKGCQNAPNLKEKSNQEKSA
jgi:hypothetical protein